MHALIITCAIYFIGARFAQTKVLQYIFTMPRHVITSQQLMSFRKKDMKRSPNYGSGQQSVGKKSLSTTIVRAVTVAVRTIC